MLFCFRYIYTTHQVPVHIDCSLSPLLPTIAFVVLPFDLLIQCFGNDCNYPTTSLNWDVQDYLLIYVTFNLNLPSLDLLPDKYMNTVKDFPDVVIFVDIFMSGTESKRLKLDVVKVDDGNDWKGFTNDAIQLW